MTKEQLKKEYPETYNEVFNEGVKKERNKKPTIVELFQTVESSKN